MTWGYGNILPPGTHFDLGVLKHFELKNQTKNIITVLLRFSTISSLRV